MSESIRLLINWDALKSEILLARPLPRRTASRFDVGENILQVGINSNF